MGTAACAGDRAAIATEAAITVMAMSTNVSRVTVRSCRSATGASSMRSEPFDALIPEMYTVRRVMTRCQRRHFVGGTSEQFTITVAQRLPLPCWLRDDRGPEATVATGPAGAGHGCACVRSTLVTRFRYAPAALYLYHLRWTTLVGCARFVREGTACAYRFLDRDAPQGGDRVPRRVPGRAPGRPQRAVRRVGASSQTSPGHSRGPHAPARWR